MHAFAKAVVLAAGLALAASSAHAVDPFFPTFGNNGIDVRNYDLDLDVAMPSSRLTAKATLDIRALEDITTFRLDLTGLSVSEVLIDGVAAVFNQRNESKLTIRPRVAIPKGKSFKAVISYAGAPKPIQDPTVPDDPSYQLGWFTYDGATYALSEPVGASTFYPSNDEPTDKATFNRIAITVPAGYTAVANGLLKSTTPLGAKTRFVWSMDEPMTTWLATVHINRFDVKVTATTTGKPLRFYSTAATPAADVASYAKSRSMIAYFETLVGPYPFDSYGSVVVDDPALYYALETQGMSTFPLGAADEGIVAHELAHQWFGDSVSVAAWADLWLAEGFATYFEVLWPNRRSPAAFDAAMRRMHDYAVDAQLGPAVVDRPEDIFSDRTYVRGALALYALQLKVGTETFFRIARTWQETYRGRNSNSRQFILTAVDVSGDRTVSTLLSDWLFKAPVPPLPGGQPSAARRLGPAPKPDLVGLRCGRGSHRGSPAVCAGAAAN